MDIGQCLAGHLPQRIAGHQRLRFFLTRNQGGGADHLPLVDNHAIFRRHFGNGMALKLFQIDHVELHAPLITG